jgi:hypothetical protein
LGGTRSSRAVFTRLWDAYGKGRLDDALHLIDPGCHLRVSVTEVDAGTIVVTGHVTAFDHSGRRVYDAPLMWMALFSDGRLRAVTSYSSRDEALAAAAEPRAESD